MERLVEAVQRRARERAQRFVGRTMEVLVEGAARRDPSQLRGRTRHNKAVNFEGTARAGELVEVEIDSATSQTLTGHERLLSRVGVSRRPMRVLAIFGPTAVGKTGRRDRGRRAAARARRGPGGGLLRLDPGLPRARGPQRGGDGGGARAARAPAARDRRRSTRSSRPGRFAALAHAEIDALLAEGRRPIVVGGTGLYLRAALAELELRPPVPSEVRAEVEAELAERGPEALHAELAPELASGVHPNDRKRIARLTELSRLGIAAHPAGDAPVERGLRVPTTARRADGRPRRAARRGSRRGSTEMVARGRRGARCAAPTQAGASRTARAAIGFDELLAGDVEAMKRAQWRFARRQLTWMRRMEDVTRIDRTGRDDADVAAEIVAMLDRPRIACLGSRRAVREVAGARQRLRRRRAPTRCPGS